MATRSPLPQIRSKLLNLYRWRPAGSYELHFRYISKSRTAQTAGPSGAHRAEPDFLSLAYHVVVRAGGTPAVQPPRHCEYLFASRSIQKTEQPRKFSAWRALLRDAIRAAELHERRE